MPAGRVRRAGAARGARPAAQPRRSAWSASTRPKASPFAPEPAVQLDRRLHVRGRRAAGRAAGRGAGARPRPAARAARRRGAARAARPRRARRPRARAAVPRRRSAGPHAPTSCTTCCARLGDLIADRARPAVRGRRARPRGSPSSSPSAGPSTVRIGGEERFIAAEDAARYRDALGCALPLGLPAAFTDPVARPLEDLVGRYARTHGPFLAADVAAPVRRCRSSGSPARWPRSRPTDRVVRGEFRPDGVEREWCDVDVLRQLRRRSLAALRREVEPVEQEALARFLPAWHGIPAHRRGLEALVEALGVLQGAAARGVDARARRAAGARARLPAGRPRRAVHRAASWCGSAPARSARRDGRVRLASRDQLAAARARRGSAPSRPDGAAPRGAPRAPRPSGARASGASCGRPRPARTDAGAAGRAVGPRVGGRGHQRLARAAAGACSAAPRPKARRGAPGRVGRGRPRPGRLTPDRAAGRRRAGGAWSRRCCEPAPDADRGRRTPARCSCSSATAS